MSNIARLSARTASGFALGVAMTATAQPSAELKADLFGALALEGHYCESIDEVNTESADNHMVSCANGRRFRVTRGQGNLLAIVELDRKTPPAAAGRNPIVRRHLFSIVNLSGQRCDRVTEWRHLSRLSYQLRCANNSSFKILVAPNGRIVVAEQ